MQDFTTDGVIDGTGPLPDFQTFQFSGNFTGLTRVEIPTCGWSLDNLVVASVPEPGTCAQLLLGGLTLLALARGRKRNSGGSQSDHAFFHATDPRQPGGEEHEPTDVRLLRKSSRRPRMH